MNKSEAWEWDATGGVDVFCTLRRNTGKTMDDVLGDVKANIALYREVALYRDVRGRYDLAGALEGICIILEKLVAAHPNSHIKKCVCSGVHGEGVCPVCKKEMGITAGQAALALNVLKAK